MFIKRSKSQRSVLNVKNGFMPFMVKNKFRAFTLIELLIVVAIIGVLASVVVVAVNSNRDKSKLAKTKSDIRQYITAAKLYSDDNNGAYPANSSNGASPSGMGTYVQRADCTVSIPGGGSFSWSNRYSSCWFVDGWGFPMDWDNDGTKVGIHASAADHLMNAGCTGNDICYGVNGYTALNW